MSRFRRACRLTDVEPGRQRFVSIEAVELAVFHLAASGEIVATSNSCPHAGGNLSAGEVAGAVVTCPWHQWEFDLASGRCVHSETVTLRRFPTRVVDGWIEVDLDGFIAPT